MRSIGFLTNRILYLLHITPVIHFALALAALAPATVFADPPSFPGIPADRTVSVTAFGANGSDALDDTTAIQQAINFVFLQGGGTVTFPPGTYIINSVPGYNQGFSAAVWMKSHVRLLGAGARHSILKMPAGSRTDPTDRYVRQNRSIVMIGDPAYLIQDSPDLLIDPTKWQDDIEIAYLGFDLDNGGGRRAIQMRYAARNVRIHHCEGFQSGVEAGEIIQEGLGKDNHFFNLASYGVPMDLGIQSDWVDISQSITVDNNIARDFLQLTADGGFGVRNLWIHHNQVYDAQEFGIGITFTGAIDTIMEDLLIEDNQIFTAGGAGIAVWPNYTGDLDLHGIELQVLRRVTIRRNQITAKLKSYAGSGPAVIGQTSAGIGVASFLTEIRDIRIEDNILTVEDSRQSTTSRQAIRLLAGSDNWVERWKHQHSGVAPLINSSGFDLNGGMITLVGHGLFTGAQVQFAPAGPTALPVGIESYRSYRLTKIDDDRFSLAQLSGPALLFGPAPAGGVYKVMVCPVAENIVVANNTISGGWDWDIYSEIQTNRFQVYGNSFCCRLELRNTHDDLHFFGNTSSGILYFPDTTLRNSLFYDNTWTVIDSPASPFNGGAIVRFGPVNDRWRRVEATFKSNQFSFSAELAPRTILAVWMVPGAWAGSGSIQMQSNQFTTPLTLNWGVDSQFIASPGESVSPPASPSQDTGATPLPH